MTLILLGMALAPVLAGWLCVLFTRSTGGRAFLAWFLGIALLVFATWFGGRADERPLEGVLAGVGVVALLYVAWRLRRSNQIPS